MALSLTTSLTMLFLLLHVDKESRIDDRTREIRSKDEKIRQMEMIIHEKSKSIDSLMSEIESLQVRFKFHRTV